MIVTLAQISECNAWKGVKAATTRKKLRFRKDIRAGFAPVSPMLLLEPSINPAHTRFVCGSQFLREASDLKSTIKCVPKPEVDLNVARIREGNK